MLVSIVITLLFLSPNLLNGFLNWDDSAYVLQNELIKDLSFKGIKEIFVTPEIVSTYAPLVMISWAIDYAIAGLNPAMFHATNLILHVLIVILVFYFTQLLSKNRIVAFITAILFGIHPMHVEAIGWVSARKDLLYTLFFMGALVVYYFYTNKENKYPKYYYYILCLVFFILSLLSKGTAVILPLILLLLDYLKERRLTYKLFIEKIPFILLSVFFVFLSIKMQVKGGAMEDRQFVNLLDSFSVGFYGYLTYLIKAIVPYNLSAYHPYPNKLGETNPWYFYASAIPVLTVFVWLMTQLKKNREIVFGFGFFFISLIPVIQVLPFGSAVMADRYTYLPYLGIFYLISLGLIYLYDTFKKCQKVIQFALPIYILILGAITFQYSKTFESGETLWTNVIKHYPNDFLAYMNRAEYRISKEQYLSAIEDSNEAIKHNSNYFLLYYNRSFVYNGIGDKKKAMNDLTQVIKMDPNFVSGYLNRGILYKEEGKLDKAIIDFSSVIKLDSNNYKAYYNRANLYIQLGLFQEALKDLDHVILLGKILSPALILRAELRLLMGNRKLALNDYNKAIKLDPTKIRGIFGRGKLYLNERNYDLAIIDFQSVINLDTNLADAHINLGVAYMNMKMINNAFKSFSIAESIDPSNYLISYNRGLLLGIEKKYLEALQQFEICLEKKPDFTQARNQRENFRSLIITGKSN